MSNRLSDLSKNNAIILLISIISIILCIAFEDPKNTKTIKVIIEIIKQFGIAITIASTIGFYMNYKSESWFSKTILDALKLKSTMADSGILDASTKFRSVEWSSLLKGSSIITLYNIRYSYQWIKTNQNELIQCLNKKNGKLILAVPNYENNDLMNYFAKKHKSTLETERRLIEDSILQSKNTLEAFGINTSEKLDIKLTDYYPTYAMYKFSDHMVLTIYGHAKRFDAPTFILLKGGTLFQTISEDFDRLITSTENATNETVSND